jgi:flagellar biosynthesis/type III secretory pathway chaperone
MQLLDTNTLTKTLFSKCELLVQLRKLGVQQNELIDAGELGQLLGLLAEKQRLLDSLQKIERQLDPFRAQSPGDRDWNSEEDRRRGAELAAACEKLLAEVAEAERQSATKLMLRRNEAATQLQAVHFAVQARAAYVATERPGFSQVDLSAE